ncbi:MAG: helix-turn-helix transcriptional regulator [Clostridia bacterium]|nr:helix-turn-helix transcriptional regulator [Clostridia bacterium]
MIGEKIRILRKLFSLKQIEFAKIFGVSVQCISDWENGRTQISLEMVIKIADHFKVSTDFLLGRSQYHSIYTKGLSNKEI